MLRALMEKAANMQEQKDHLSGKMETLIKNQKKMLEIKIILVEMKNAVDLPVD